MHIWKVLLVGDLHLGRTPGGLVDAETGVSVSSALERLVDEAVRLRVHAVCFSGDILDRTNAYFEAAGQFERAVRKLRQNGREVICVSGNHDWNTLPTLKSIFTEARLLGSPGGWSNFTLEAEGGYRLEFTGYGFPGEECSGISFEDFKDPTAAASIGLLHCDLGQSGSVYGPLDISALLQHNVSVWSLGHIHTRVIHRPADPMICYPGSLQPLHINERGLHGAELIELSADGRLLSQQQICLATIYFQEMTLPVPDSCNTRELVMAFLRDSCAALVEALADNEFEHIALRLTFETKECSFAAVERVTKDLVLSEPVLSMGSQVWIESVRLKYLAEQEPMGPWAGMLLDDLSEIEKSVESAESSELVAEAIQHFRQVLGEHFDNAFSSDDNLMTREATSFLQEAGAILKARISGSSGGSNVA